MISCRPTERGWTLIELVSVVALVGILAAVLLSGLPTGVDAAKTEMTLQKMEAIKKGILGSDHGGTSEGIRRQFGFLGDIGRLPAGLGELTTRGSIPVWSYSTAYRVGAGWRGPYVSGGDSDSPPPSQDAWGRPFVYATTGATPSLASLGADGVAGGASDNTDLTVSLPPSEWRSRVSGNLRDGNAHVSGASVRIWYPVDGALTSASATTDANGFYQFNSVPFGVRPLEVTSPTALGPNPIVLSRSEVSVPDTAFNFLGGSEAASLVSGSVVLYDGGTTLKLLLKSTYAFTVQLSTIKVTWPGGGNYSRVVVNGIGQEVSPAAVTDDTTVLSATMLVPPNSEKNSLEIRFSTSVTGQVITILLGWLNRTKTDSISFTAP